MDPKPNYNSAQTQLDLGTGQTDRCSWVEGVMMDEGVDMVELNVMHHSQSKVPPDHLHIVLPGFTPSLLSYAPQAALIFPDHT